MLVFIDESYDRADDPNPKSTFSAVLVREQRCRELDRKLFELKRHFWKVQNSYELELKGRLLLTERSLELPKNREFMEQFIALFREIGVVTFAVTQDGTFPLASKSERLPNLYRALLWRVNTLMSERFPEDYASFFFDGIDHRTNQKIAISFSNFMHKHRWGQGYRQILTTPFFCDSEVTPGIQMADVLAYCVNERMKGRRGYIDDFFKHFRDLSSTYVNEDEELVLNGFQKIRGDWEQASGAGGAVVVEERSLEIKETTRVVETTELKREETGG